MLLTNHESTEDLLIKILLKKEYEATEIREILKNAYKKAITLPALYRSIKTLVDGGAVLKKGKYFTVSREWAENLVNTFSVETKKLLSEGEDISYSFKSLSALDSYWKHTIVQLRKELSNYPIFFYNDHVIWLHLEDRKESQTTYLNSFDAEKRYAGFVVGGETLIDKEFKKVFSKKFLQVELRKIDSIKHDSVTVHGDYVVTVKYKKQTTDFVRRLYKNSKSISDLEDILKKSFEGALPVKMTIERDSEKADKLRKVLSKNFYIPKEIRKEFNL